MFLISIGLNFKKSFLKGNDISIALDFICNNDCLMCANTPEERKNNFRLETEEVKNYLLDIDIEKDDIVEFSGGEPTIREDILDLSKFFKENFDGNLVTLTNARKLSDENFANKLSNYVDRIVTAFYSPKPAKHDFITQRKNSFNEAFKGVKNMENAGIDISLKTIPMKQNYKELPEFIDFAFENFENPTVFFSGMDLRGYAKINQDIVSVKYSDIMPYLESAFDRANELGKEVYIFTTPLCSIDPFYWDKYSVCMGEISKDIEFLVPGRTTKKDKGLLLENPSHECYDCVFGERCFWGWEGYVEKYGNEEFKAFIK